MNPFSKIIFLIIILTGIRISSFSQEYVLPLENNPVLKGHSMPENKKAVNEVLLEIPIVDDFSYNSIYPSSKIWADNYAYINTGYAVNPPTIGVATMDALDWNGSVYSFATISPETFDADYLTSYPINLNYPVSDSVYLSFYYQPQGNGLQPNPGDSLCLDFFDPQNDLWTNVWRVAGDTLSSFKQVMVPIRESRFLTEGFRFGFRNKASLPKNSHYKDKRGNVDHWNIDYIYLNRQRFRADTVLRDVAFQKPTPSMLKKYESIPWDHLKVAYNTIYNPYITFHYVNNDTATRNVTRSVDVYDEVLDKLYAPSNSSAQDILPRASNTFALSMIYPFQFSQGDTASFLIRSWLRTDDFDNKANDTLLRRQLFRDYFAYDDGSAERSYGLRGQGTSNGLIAVRFDSYIPDELGGVDVYFTQLKDSLNLGYYFKFMVWDDNEGVPGELIYEGSSDITVDYSDKLNKFVRFWFDRTISINGKYYVGTFQYNSYMLNIGLDINTPNNGNLFYNLGEGWTESAAPGTLLLRPFVKRNYSSRKDYSNWQNSVQIFPNPADDWINLQLPESERDSKIKISIYTISGKLVASFDQFQDSIYTGSFTEGVYFITFLSNSGQIRTEKLLIHR